MSTWNIFTGAVQSVWADCHQPRTEREQAVLEFLVSASRWVHRGKTWNTDGRLWKVL